MKKTPQKAPRFRFFSSFLLPALLVFFVPVFSFFFFRHAEHRFDEQVRDSFLDQIRNDQRLTAMQRARAIEFFTDESISNLRANKKFTELLSAQTRFHYATFHWMIYLSAGSVLAGVVVFLLAGVCVALSLHSQYVQYLSLSAGWHVLRAYGALQVVVQGILLFALSFWITALWTNSYLPALMIIAGLIAFAGVSVVVGAMFRRVNERFSVEGGLIRPDEAAPLWDELRRICARVGTEPPDQIIAGIDENFYVTEHPVTVGGRTYRGRTLFVSLSLLKQMQGGEADAVLAHEMAHFSGQDTEYSRKISPLLRRYDIYLHALREGGVTLPVYYYMLCFRALYQLSLRRLSRQREFRADWVAAHATSVFDAAGALLRTVAYSKYRDDVERGLFKHERALEAANVRERTEQGFSRYAASFVCGPDVGQLAPAHPFDTHPPLRERLVALGLPLESAEAQSLLSAPGDGRWYQLIPGAEEIEREQWQPYEEQLRVYHEKSLPFRFLPETDEERAIVAAAFPPLTFSGSDGAIALDHEQLAFDGWPEPIRFAEVAKLGLDQNGDFWIKSQVPGKKLPKIKMSNFPSRIDTFNAIHAYHGRYLAAVEYQKQKQQEAGFTTGQGSHQG